MLTTIAKRVQTRLSKQGVKVALSYIRPVVEQMINDIENPTDQEVLSVVEYFLSTANKLIVVDDVPAEQTEIEETLTTEDVDIVDNVDNINTASIQDIDSSDLYIQKDVKEAIAPQTDSAPLATTNKNEIIASTAGELGIVLNTSEINQIADNFDAGSDDFSATLEQVKGAIIAYVQHRIATNNQRIVDTINEISQIASDGFADNSQTLSDGFKHLNQQLQQQSTDFKSKLAGTLSRFQLPAA